MDGSDRLCQALYGGGYSPSKMLGGSQAPMLHDAATEIVRLRMALERIASETAATWVSDVAKEALNPGG